MPEYPSILDGNVTPGPATIPPLIPTIIDPSPPPGEDPVEVRGIDLENLNFNDTQLTTGETPVDPEDLIPRVFLDLRIPAASGYPAGTVLLRGASGWAFVLPPSGMVLDPALLVDLATGLGYWDEPEQVPYPVPT
jgi:hypothetical protein